MYAAGERGAGCVSVHVTGERGAGCVSVSVRVVFVG